jgi:hypothetical protein
VRAERSLTPASPGRMPERAAEVRAPVESEGAAPAGAAVSDDAPLLERVLAAASRRPMFCSMLRGARIVSEDDDRVTVAFDPGQRSAAIAHLDELKPFFAQATGNRGIELVVEGGEKSPGSGSEPGEDVSAPSTPASRVEVDLDHPLIRQVAELFDATPRRVEPRGGGEKNV